MLSASTSYLDEYRRRYGNLGFSLDTKRNETTAPIISDVNKLLERYLNSERTGSIAEIGTNESGDHKDIHATVSNVGITSASITSASITSENEEDRCVDLEDVFQDDLENSLFLPTGTLSHAGLTVDKVFTKDPQLPKQITNKRHVGRSRSNPLEERAKKPEGRRSTRLNSSFDTSDKKVNVHIGSDGNQLSAIDGLPGTEAVTPIRSRHSSSSFKQGRVLRRHDSSLSNKSIDSNHSRNSHSKDGSDIIEIFDEDLDFEYEDGVDNSLSVDMVSQQQLLRLLEIDNTQSDQASRIVHYESGACVNCQASNSQISSTTSAKNMCKGCKRQQTERLKTAEEILSSEQSYLNDLLVIKKEFVDQLCHTGLVTELDLSNIFGNLSDLISVSRRFVEELQAFTNDKHQDKQHQDNQDHQDNYQDDSAYYSAGFIGKLICDSSAMFLAYEAYCLNYSNAVATIDQLRKENELFNLFLEASQRENVQLRRMDIKTFLMIPVQRIMKYPLLLNRLLKATPESDPSKKDIALATQKFTNILLHINTQSKLLSNLFSPSKELAGTKKRTSLEIALTKLCLDTVKWKHNEIHIVISGKIGFLPTLDSQSVEKLKNLRLNTAYAVIISKGRDNKLNKNSGRGLLFPSTSLVLDAALIIMKKTNTKLQLLREPFHLKNCIVTRNSEFYDVFEVQEEVKEAFVIRPVNNSEAWYKHSKYFSMVLGGRNQRRRNALPNILLNG